MALRLTENYFPQTIGSVNAMWLLAQMQMSIGEKEKSVDLLIRIMLESIYVLWVNWAEQMLTRHWMDTDNQLKPR